MSNQANSIAIKNSLSAARIGTYEAVTTDLNEALKLYQWNADVFSLIFNLYFIDSRYLEQEENVFNPLIWHALLKKSVS